MILSAYICIILLATNFSDAKKKKSKHRKDPPQTVEEEADEQQESSYWERVYVFRSDSIARGPPKPAQQINMSRAGFMQDLIRLEKLCQRVNGAVESYTVCYRKYGFNLDESMYNVNQFNEHVNETYNTVKLILRKEPNDITHSELDRVIKGVDAELRRQAFDDLSQDPGFSGPVPCCGIELESLRKELQGSHNYTSAECNSVAGKEARRKMLREARKFRKEELQFQDHQAANETKETEKPAEV